MLKKTITYRDFNDEERTEDFYFNLTEAELAEMELGTQGGFGNKLEQILKAKDTPTLASIFKDILLRSYGVKSDDGKRFIKDAELTKAFTQTNAYSDFYMELATDDQKAAAFIKAVLPAKYSVSVTDAST